MNIFTGDGHWWRFWNWRSGMVGGCICGAVVGVLVYVVWRYGL